MSTIQTYLPLYRRYRPLAFTDLVGQEVITQTLGNAILHDQVAHAYLLCGPRGTGKTSTARIFAKALNCTQKLAGANPCNQCDSCQSITNGTALDVIEFDAASNNKVEDARDLIEGCQFAPMSGGYKVYIIDEVHMLTTQAFNSLLKTLEEPPPNVIFIFATTEAHKVLPTIVSRCQRFDFARIDSATMVKRLAYIAEQEKIAIAPAALQRIARQARGGLRDAVGMLDQLSVLSRAEANKLVDVADVALLVGTVQEDRLLALSQSMATHQAQLVLDTVNELFANGVEPNQLVRDLTQHFRNLLIVQVSGERAATSGLDLDADYLVALQAQAQTYLTPPNTHQRIPDLLNRLSKLAAMLRQSQQPELWLEITLVDMALAMDPWSELQGLKARVEALEQGKGVPGPQVIPAPTVTPSPAPSTIPAASTPVSVMAPAAGITAPSSPSPEEIPSPAAAVPAIPPAPVIQAAPSPPAIEPTVTQAMPEPVASAAPQAPVSAAPASISSGGGMSQTEWQNICQQVKNNAYRSLLSQQTFVSSLTNDQLVIGCPSEPIMGLLRNPKKLQELQTVVDQAIRPGLQINFDLASKAASSMPPEAVTSSNPPLSAATASVPTPPPSVPAAPPSASSPVVSPAMAATAVPVPGLSQPTVAPPNVDEPSSVAAPAQSNGSIMPGVLAAVPFQPPSNDPELQEAKQYTMTLLNGKVVD